jgi:hypothetical protein
MFDILYFLICPVFGQHACSSVHFPEAQAQNTREKSDDLLFFILKTAILENFPQICLKSFPLVLKATLLRHQGTG